MRSIVLLLGRRAGMSQDPRANGDGSSEGGTVPEEEYKQYHVKKIEVDLHVPSDWVG